MKFTMVAVVSTLCAAGCVTQATYDLLQQDYDKLKSEYDALTVADQATQASYIEVQQALQGEQARSEELAQRIATLTNELAASKSQLTRLQAEHADVLKDKSKLKASIDDMQAALADAQRRKALADQRIAAYNDLLARFKTLIDAGTLKVRIIDGQMVVQLATDILFPSGSAKLSTAGSDAVREVTAVLASMPERRYEIAGHTDNVPISTSRYPSNWELGFARANAVAQTMLEAGMPPQRLKAASYGEFRPTAPNDSDAGRAANRRIEIVVVPDLSDLPGSEELQKAGS